MTFSRRKRKNNIAGGLFSNTKKVSSPECDVSNLSSLSKDLGDGNDPLLKMQNNYATCCPKDFLGRKNKSPYCKQLKLNFDAQAKLKNDTSGYHGDETDVAKIKSMMNDNDDNEPKTKKPWYYPFGGRRNKTRNKTRRKTRRKRI
jgi:hypothetical protein